MATTEAPRWNLEAERALWRAACAPGRWLDKDGNAGTHPDSLWHFLCRAWGASYYLKSHPSEPQWLYEPIHRPYCAWYQRHVIEWKRLSLLGDPGQYRLLTLMPRGYGKTVTSTKAASLWMMLDEPDLALLLQCANGDLAEDIYKAMIGVLGGGKTHDRDSWFVWLYGDWVAGATEKTKTSIKHGYRQSSNVSEPSIDTSGAGAGATGYHPRVVKWDDPLEKNKLKEDRTAYLRGQRAAVTASRNALQQNGLFDLTCTRYLDNDIAGHYLREEGVATWTGMPCPHMSIFDKIPFGHGKWHVYFMQTEDEDTGLPTHPRLWNEGMIAEKKRVDAEDFAGQQQNNPGASEASPLIESQIPWLYVSYADFLWDTQVEYAVVCIDTAFKSKERIGLGDDSVIVVWLKSSRDDGILYLDTELLFASNECREEDFNKKLVETCLNLRRRGIWIKAITDEVEPGGKAGTYKNRVLGILRTAGFNVGDEQFVQFNRTKDKKSRIRTAAGHWAEGYVRILLHKGDCNCPPAEYDVEKRMYKPRQCPHFGITRELRKLTNQIVKVDTTQYDDLADAAADGFAQQLWNPPNVSPGILVAEATTPVRPWDNDLKDIGKPMTNEQLIALMAERDEMRQDGFDDDGLHSIDLFDEPLPREPV